MALNIKDADTDRLARRLAAQTGESITEATRVAIEERLARLAGPRPPDGVGAALRDIMDRGRRRAVLDDRSPEDIVGYDEHGLPR